MQLETAMEYLIDLSDFLSLNYEEWPNEDVAEWLLAIERVMEEL